MIPLCVSNAGHSALLWLLASPSAHVVMFDLGTHASVDVGFRWLRDHPRLNATSRLELIKGPSNETVPRFAAERRDVLCNLLSIDGGHSKNEAEADLEHMEALADPCCHIGFIDDCPLRTSKRTSTNAGVIAAYHSMQRRKRVCSLLTAQSEPEFWVGRFTLRGLTVFTYPRRV